MSYRFSYRDLVEMMDKRGLKIAHTTLVSGKKVNKKKVEKHPVFQGDRGNLIPTDQ